MPRRKWSADEKMAIVLAGLMPRANISAIYQGRGGNSSAGVISSSLEESSLQDDPASREQKLEKQLREAQAKIGEQAMQIDIFLSRGQSCFSSC